MKGYDKNKESPFLKYWGINNLCSWAILQKFPGNGLKWVKHLSQFDEDSIKSYNEKSKEGYFLKVDTQYPQKLHELYKDLPFLPERMKIEKVEKLLSNLHDKSE